jgi:hypothetical protein
VLYDTLVHLSYNGDVPVYRGLMSMAHGLDRCEVSVTIPLNPVEIKLEERVAVIASLEP